MDQVSAIAGGSAITTENSFATRGAFVAWDVAATGKIAGMVIFAAGLSYVYDGVSTAIPDLQGWVPGGDWTPQHMGAIGDGLSDDTDAVQRLLDVLPVGAVGKLRGTFGVSRRSKDGRTNGALYWTRDNIFIDGAGGKIIRLNADTDDFYNVLCIQRNVVNGQSQIKRGGVYGLEVDGGLQIQRLSDPDFDFGASGWARVGTSGAVAYEGPLSGVRGLRITSPAGGTAKAAVPVSVPAGTQVSVLVETRRFSAAAEMLL